MKRLGRVALAFVLTTCVCAGAAVCSGSLQTAADMLQTSALNGNAPAQIRGVPSAPAATGTSGSAAVSVARKSQLSSGPSSGSTAAASKNSQSSPSLQAQKLAELDSHPGEYDPQSLILQYTSHARAEAVAARLGARLRITADGSFAQLDLPTGTDVQSVIASADNVDFIEQAFPDWHAHVADVAGGADTGDSANVREHAVPQAFPQGVADGTQFDDTYYSRQTYLDYIVPDGSDVGDVLSEPMGSSPLIAIIDTGIDVDHAEFAGRISAQSYNATQDLTVEDAGVDVVDDTYSHGTQVAGVVAAAANNGAGVVGIAPSAELMVVKAEVDGSGTFKDVSDLVFGLYYAAEQGADIINMSIGAGGYSDVFASAVDFAIAHGSVVVAAAGNHRAGDEAWDPEDPMWPAANENVIGVGALNASRSGVSDQWDLAATSNYMQNTTLVAPGAVYTTNRTGGYTSNNGTSFASPIVAAALARYLSQHGSLTQSEAFGLLQATSRDLGDAGKDERFGFGALDLKTLLDSAKGTATFHANASGVDDVALPYEQGHTLQAAPALVREGYAVAGWYLDAALTQPFDPATYVFTGTADVDLYAKWASAAGEKDEYVYYDYVRDDSGNVLDGTFEVSDCGDDVTNAVIDSSFYDDEEDASGEVVGVGYAAFYDRQKLRAVTLPSGITEVKEAAFHGCSNLASVRWSETLRTVGYEAFLDCGSLQSVSLPASVRKIDDLAFAGCSGIETLVLPEGLTAIGRGAFANCTSLRSVVIPSTVTDLDAWAFYGCAALERVVFADGSRLQTLGTRTFGGCTSLQAVSFGSNSRLATVSTRSFEGDSVLEVIDMTGCTRLATIASRAVVNCPKLETLNLADLTAVDIADDAFIGVAPAFQTTHVHLLSVHTKAMSPTCTDPGNVEYWTCSRCGERFADEGASVQLAESELAIPALGHAWDEGEVTTQPTCTEPGVRTSRCTRDGCGATKTEAEPAVGHMWDTEWHMDQDKHWHVCTVCGELGEEAAHDYSGSAVEIDGVNYSVCEACGHTTCADGHDWDRDNAEIVKAASCTENGARIVRCRNAHCGAEQTEEAPALGHNHNGVWLTDAEYHWHHCIRCEEDVDKAVHEWDAGTVTEQPTCTQPGERTLTCKVCGVTKTEVVPATGHTFGTEWNSDGTKHWHVCEVCGYMADEAEHTWDAGTPTVPATCTAEGEQTFTCTACGATKTESVPKLEHTWDAGETTVPATCAQEGERIYTCTACGTTKAETLPKTEHIWDEGTVTKEPTCTAEGERTFTCTECGTSRTETIAMLPHTFDADAWESDGSTHWHTCTACGTHCDEAAHVAEGGWLHEGTRHWQLCDVCGAAVGLGTHSYSTSWQADAGGHWRYCTDCGAEAEKIAHAFGEWRRVSNPTLTTPGADERSCATCGYAERRAVVLANTTATLAATSYEYTGAPVRPAVAVVATDGDGGTRQLGSNEVSVAYSGNVNVGTATATVSAPGYLAQPLALHYTIARRSIAGAAVSGVKASYAYTGRTVPAGGIKLSVAGRNLTAGTDYTLRQSALVSGAAVLSFTGIGNYTGSITARTVIVPSALGKLSVQAKSGRRLVVKWTSGNVKLSKPSGYELVVRYGSKAIKTVRITKLGTVKKTLRLATRYRSKKVSVSIAAYKTVAGKRMYGPALSSKKLTVKR